MGRGVEQPGCVGALGVLVVAVGDGEAAAPGQADGRAAGEVEQGVEPLRDVDAWVVVVLDAGEEVLGGALLPVRWVSSL